MAAGQISPRISAIQDKCQPLGQKKYIFIRLREEEPQEEEAKIQISGMFFFFKLKETSSCKC